MIGDIKELLNHIDVNACDYDKWIHVGMAVKSEDATSFGLALWDEWSSHDTRLDAKGRPMYKKTGPFSCAEKWKTFTGTGYTVATLAMYAAEEGYKVTPKGYTKENDVPFVEGAVINEKPSAAGRQTESEPSPEKQLETYLRTVFDPDDYVGYVTSSARFAGGRWLPDKGVYTRTAGEIISSLEESGGSVVKAVGAWHEGCGAWIRINPLDGKGVSDANVTDFRHALVESDSEPLQKQKEIYERLKLPVACLVESGGKSLHAIIKIDARNIEEYRERVDFLYTELEKAGLRPDRADKNPARLSRMPGVTRNGILQRLVGVNLGLTDFAEWRHFALTGKLPPQTFNSVLMQPSCPYAVVKGLLLSGRKVLITGPEKCGKSCLVTSLCLAVSSGKFFLGLPASRGKILYINASDPEDVFIRRTRLAASAAGAENARNFRAVSLRNPGKPEKPDAADLLRYHGDMGYSLIVVDAVSGILPENRSNPEREFLRRAERLCDEKNCCVAYAESEGPLADKLAAGSDVVVTLTEGGVEVKSKDFPDMKIKTKFTWPVREGGDGTFRATPTQAAREEK